MVSSRPRMKMGQTPSWPRGAVTGPSRWMLGLFGLLGLILAVALPWWLWPGGQAELGGEAPIPTADPPASGSGSGSVRQPATLGSMAPKPLPTTRPLARGEGEREERALISRLRRQGVFPAGVESLTRQELVLYPEVLTHLGDSSNWMPELMKASSSIVPRLDGEPTLLSLDRVAADSVLWEFGLREGDVIALIDGEIPQFSPTRALEYIRKADAVMAALDQGGSVSLTVVRQGQPLHLVYRRW